MPRGVAIPELREQLFAAVDRLLVREGPSGLTTRAITTEAGCAKGILHNHFSGLDGFLAEYVLASLRTAQETVAKLPAQAGQATVADNLAEMASSLLRSRVLAAHTMVMFRPSVVSRLRETRRHWSPDLSALERTIIRYLDAEKDLGRVAAAVDTSAVAIALVASLDRILMTRSTDATTAQNSLAGVVAVLVAATAVQPAR